MKMNIQPFFVSSKNWASTESVEQTEGQNKIEINLRRKKQGQRLEKKKKEIELKFQVEEEGGLRSICRFGKLGVFKP